MPTAGGPNTLGESNLVFAYDTGDVKNSYKGQPTTNAVGNLNSYNPLDLYTWAPNGNTSTWTRDYTPKSPVGGISLKQISSGTDSYSDTYNSSQDNIIAASSGQTWTVSVYALATAGTNLQVWIFGANSSGNYIELNVNSFTATGVWQRISVTMTFTNGSTAYVQSRVATSTNGGVVWWDGLQVEQKSYPTSFTTGTRSVTQGLLPVIGNSTIDLTNVSFDSNAKMIFDGTNDYANLSGSYLTNLDTSTLSIEIVFKTNVITGNAITLLGWHENEYPHGYICLGNFTGYWGNETISFYNEGPGTTALSFAYTNGHSFLSDTLYHHVVFILQTNNYKIYIDGVEVAVNASFRNGSQSTVMPSNLFGYGTTPSVVLGTGSDPAGGFFNGQIPVTKIYNRALTAQEVKQNYQQYKTRFNLS
jgi:hypothetical protein